MSTDSSDSISEPVLDSDAEKEPKSDLKPGVESVFDFDSGAIKECY